MLEKNGTGQWKSLGITVCPILILWNLQEQKPERIFNAGVSITDFTFSSDKLFLVASGWDGSLNKFFLSTGKRANADITHHRNAVIGCGINSEGEILSASWDGRILLWHKDQKDPQIFENKCVS